jgi:hypothetical protein
MMRMWDLILMLMYGLARNGRPFRGTDGRADVILYSTEYSVYSLVLYLLPSGRHYDVRWLTRQLMYTNSQISHTKKGLLL